MVTVTICTEHTRSRNMEATFRRKFYSVPTIVWLSMCSLDPHKFNRVEYGLCISFSGNMFSFKGGALLSPNDCQTSILKSVFSL